MSFIRSSSPHLRHVTHTGRVMRLVILATLPGVAAMTFFFGWGTLINLVFASMLALAFEAICVKMRKRPLGFYLNDGSAVLTAVLLALALPPMVPWWVTTVGIFVAIVLAKQLYGGIGQNPFNPAMIAYALLLISFPVQMTQWAQPFVMVSDAWAVPGFIDTLKVIFVGAPSSVADALSGPTPLDVMRHRNGLTTEEAWLTVPVLTTGIGAWHAVSIAYLAGGAFLIYKKIFTWHTPVALLISLTVISAVFYGLSPDTYASPMFHLTVGATMLGAFFIATDPVSAATSNRGKLIYGAGIGLLIYIIRAWGGYPDGVAFAVLLMNLSAPFIDQYTQPRTYGHTKANRGIKGKA